MLLEAINKPTHTVAKKTVCVCVCVRVCVCVCACPSVCSTEHWQSEYEDLRLDEWVDPQTELNTVDKVRIY